MEFIVFRTSSMREEKPCEEARAEEVTPFIVWQDPHNRDKKTIEYKEKQIKWVLTLNNLEELVKFKDKYGDIILSDTYIKEYLNGIEIYDDYKE